MSDNLQLKATIEMCTILIVKNRCQFCYAFFRDRKKIAEHSIQCKFRFSETFEAFDGKVKFACAVCFDVFESRGERRCHERLHKFPGGFPCSVCDEIFLNEVERSQHQENAHEVFSSGQRREETEIVCDDCGALFEHESYLRLHVETDCGRHRSWSCIQCNLLTEDAYRAHIEFQHGLEFEEEDIPVISKYEVTSSAGENIISIEIPTKMSNNYIDASDLDPLLLVVKEETASEPDAGISRIVCEDFPVDDGEFLADENLTGVRSESSEMSFCTDSQNTLESQNVAYHEQSDETKKTEGLKRKPPSDPKLPFECNYCDRSFAAPYSLYRHKLLHGPDGSLVHKCHCCSDHFASVEERYTHMIAAHKDKMTCEICNITFRNAKTRQNHKLNHHTGRGGEKSTLRNIHTRKSHRKYNHMRRGAKKSIGCSKCGESFADQKSLDIHSQSDCRTFNHCDDTDALNADNANGTNSMEGTNSHPETASEDRDDSMSKNISKKHSKNRPKKEKKLSCPHCAKPYFAQCRLNKHIIEHGPDGSLIHKCEFCRIHFKSIGERDEHQMDVHKEKLTCNICNKSFRRLPTLHQHAQRHRRNGPRQEFVCAKCGLTFRSKIVFEGHELSDCGRSPSFECAECGKFLTNRTSLGRHMMIHRDERNFPCTFCDKKFRDSVQLKLHTRYRHTKERPHKCPYCEKCFVDASTMKTHTIVHTGIKRYVCYGCGEKYPSNSALHKHRKYRKDTCALVPIKPPLRNKDMN